MSQRSVRLPATRSAAAAIRATGEDAAGHWIDLARVRAYSGALLVLFCVLLLGWAWTSNGFTDVTMARPGTDFSAFWGASYLALTQGPLQAYDVHQLTAVIAEHGTLGRGAELILPWLYPPTFLLMVLPLSLLPLTLSYLLFLAGTGLVYFKSIAKLTGAQHPWRQGLWLPVLAAPATLITILAGQNALLTAGVAGAAVYHLNKRPVLAGVLIGLLAIKPQLAVLFPLALVISRAWKALASALLTTVAFASVSVLVCGWRTVPAFLANAQWVRASFVEGGANLWWGMPTPIAAARLAGATVTGAYAVQVLTALAMAAAMAYVWRRTTASELRAAALAIATLMVSPYLRDYELTWLGLAIAGLVGDGVRDGSGNGLSSGERAALVVAWLLPIYEHANPYLKLPQIGPLVLIAMMALVVRRVATRV
ncbi:glycosyltransferase family 87 protein [Ralstonia sp. Ralssp135]|uniref:glycosyltransferase family 87 protein n=1 Tax=Ralstonia sp. Ralssp135 TaxID=3243016 RepID=UPI0039B100D0